MRPFSDDIVEFIEQCFHADDVPKAIEVLRNNGHVLSTPRVQRAVLFLSGGSLAMLRHYVTAAALDVREILLRAEYVLDVTPEPMRVRSLADGFRYDNPVPAPLHTPLHTPTTAEHGEPMRSASRPAAPQRALRKVTAQPAYRHQQLVDRRFLLGDVLYTITTEQLHDDCVRCLRCCGNVVSIVHLPLIFVLEQLSEEHIELSGAPF
ncbi:MAG: hypothetical protein RIC56_15960 [Pseudomonadales bacterium]